MASEAGHPRQQVYDRWFLLHDKRNELLARWEVEQYGRDSFGDPDYVSIYGLAPREWYARGVRILGRTAVECTRDRLAGRIGRDVTTSVLGQYKLLFAIQVFETVEPGSLAELTARFPWSATKVDDLNAPGQNHGLLLATYGWAPG
jgi:hypothetical protein